MRSNQPEEKRQCQRKCSKPSKNLKTALEVQWRPQFTKVDGGARCPQSHWWSLSSA